MSYPPEEFEALVDELRTTARALIPTIVEQKLSLIITALDIAAGGTGAKWRNTAPLDGKEILGRGADGRVCVIQYRRWRLGDDVLADRAMRWRETNTGRLFTPVQFLVIPE